jgi:hypothetical protein
MQPFALGARALALLDIKLPCLGVRHAHIDGDGAKRLALAPIVTLLKEEIMQRRARPQLALGAGRS